MPFDDDVRDRAPARDPRAVDFVRFVDAVVARLEKGEREYGGRSFDLASPRLLDEVLEELEDVAGWAFILWCRLRRVRDVLAFAEAGTSRKDRA